MMTKSTWWLFASLGGVGLALAAAVLATALRPEFIRIQPGEVQWHDIPGGHGAQVATLYGNPDRPGTYIVRVKFPPHLMDLPHFHPHARYVTVLEGTWYTGTGDLFDPAHAVPLPAGSLMVHPGRAAHWDGSAGDGTVIVQITGEGPSESTPVDPRQPDWIEVRR
jgi:hypothetical protein